MTRILTSHLRFPEPLSIYGLSRDLHEAFPECSIIETEDWEFNLLEYAGRGRARVRVSPETHTLRKVEWVNAEEGLRTIDEIALFEVEAEEADFMVLTVQYDSCGSKRHWIIGQSEPAARRFLADVAQSYGELNDEILVYHYGQCQRDAGLYRAICSASFDDLILAGELKERLIEDFESFFDAEDLYKRYGIAWRRGLLLIGPPGNGKTHAVKALVQRVGKPCLYVRSFKSRYGEENGVLGAFQQARRMAPCVMVLEDVDSLVKPEIRSFFLNELDGFAANRGLLVVATTNHPEKLDPAIANRPSRFDRKIAFELPGPAERLAFLRRRTEPWEAELRPSEEDLDEVANRTQDFSFAYLKELCTSSLVAWMRKHEAGQMGSTMLGLVDALREQMKTEPHPEPQPAEEDGDDE